MPGTRASAGSDWASPMCAPSTACSDSSSTSSHSRARAHALRCAFRARALPEKKWTYKTAAVPRQGTFYRGGAMDGGDKLKLREPDRLAVGVEVLFDEAYARGVLVPGVFGPERPGGIRARRACQAAEPPQPERNLRFDVLIVGSGYGGAVMAARLASTGKRVAVLERGREYLPG